VTRFKDSFGNDWEIEFDAFVFGVIRDVHKIDIADDGLHKLEKDPHALVVVLHELCDTTEDLRQFAKRFKSNSLTTAFEAVRGAAADFFPLKQWSEIQSFLNQRQAAAEMFAAMRPMLAHLNHPEMPESLRQVVMEKLGELLENTGLDSSAMSPSALIQDATPSNVPSGAPELSE